MSSTTQNFTPLERAVLQAICEMHPADRTALSEQITTATIVSRQNTGAGFYTRFSLERRSNTALLAARERRGPSARIDGLKYGMGFVLWLVDGYIDCLEGYSYEEPTFEVDLEAVDFEIDLSGSFRIH